MLRRTALLTACLLAGSAGSASAAGLTAPARVGADATNQQAIGLLADGTAGQASLVNVGGAQHVVARVRPAGGAWGAAQDLGPSQVRPAIARVGGSLLLAYDKRTNLANVALATLDGGQAAFSDRGVVGAGGLDAVISPGPDGSFAVAWRSSGNGVEVLRSSSLTTLPAPQGVVGAAGVTSLAVGREAGRTLVAWAESDGTDARVEAAQRADGGSFFTGTPAPALEMVAVSTQGGASSGFLLDAVQATPQDASVVWTKSTSFVGNSTSTLRAARFTPAGSAGTPADVRPAGGPIGLVRTALAADGRTYLTYSGGASFSFVRDVFATSRDAGTAAFGTPVKVNPTPVQNGTGAGEPALAASGAQTRIAFTQDGTVRTVLAAGGAFTAGPSLEEGANAPVVLGEDGLGQFAYGYTRAATGEVGAWARFEDAVAPAVTVAGPASAVAGAPVSFTATAKDLLGTPGEVTWDFGDGTTATGASVQHSFAAPGAVTVTARSFDEAGNAGSGTSAVTVSPAPAITPPPATTTTPTTTTPPPAPPAVKAVLSALKLTSRGVSLRSSAAGSVKVTAAKRSCRKVKGKRRCRFAAKPKKASRTLTSGVQVIPLKLGKGTYRVVVTATNAGGTTKLTRTLTRR